MGKNTASGGCGGGLKKNVFGTFMNVFRILLVKIVWRVVADITYKRVGVV